jgi:hypothetical protein
MSIQRIDMRSTTAPHEVIAARTIAPTAPRDAMALRFEHAMQRFQSAEWSEAFTELRTLANRGHPPAARIALMLARRGPSLFGGSFPATGQERARWQSHGLG